MCVCLSLYLSVFSTHVWDIIQTIMMFHVNFDAEILQIENNPELIQNFVSPQPAPLPIPNQAVQKTLAPTWMFSLAEVQGNTANLLEEKRLTIGWLIFA